MKLSKAHKFIFKYTAIITAVLLFNASTHAQEIEKIRNTSGSDSTKRSSPATPVNVTSNANDGPLHTMTVAPTLAVPTAQEKKESAFYILNAIAYRYTYNRAGDNLNLEYSHHVHVHLVDDKGVESFNTIALPSYDASDFTIKARTILPDGKVKELDRSSIKEIVDEETGQKRKIFALDGLSPGSEVEYILTLQLPLTLQESDYLQTSIPTRKAVFELYAPQNLIFETHPVNGFQTIKIDTVGNKRRITAIEQNLVGIPEENYSDRLTYLLRMDYQFLKNSNNSNSKQQTWATFGSNVFNNYRSKPEERKRILSYLKDQKEFKALATQRDKIIWIENHLKTRFRVSEEANADKANDIEYVLKNKVTTEVGMCNLFTAVYQALDIPHDLVLTTDRTKMRFDKKFVSSLQLKELLIYFPDEKAYIKPDWPMMRYPLIPTVFQGNDALLCAVTGTGENQTASGEIITIPVQDPNLNNHDIFAEVTLDLQNSVAKAKLKHEMYGIMASGYRPLFLLADKDRQKQTFIDIFNLGNQSDKVTNTTKANIEFADASAGKPLILTADVESGELLEKAGPDYIVHIGKVIGKQVEMYQEKERVTDIDVDFLHHLRRTITLNIPEGYKPRNLENLAIDIKQGPPGKRYGFLSTYKVAGNQIIIDVDEWYCEPHLNKSEFEQYKAVINAAADFEKVTVLLEKI